MNFRVLVTNKIPPAGLERLRSCPGLEIDYRENGLDNAAICQALGGDGYDGMLVCFMDSISAQVLKCGYPRLQIVSTMCVGYNHIDVKAASEMGIVVCNTPDVLTESTADATVGLIITACRRFKEANLAVTHGKWKGINDWDPLWMCGTDVYGSTVGIVGLGRIGRCVARRLTGFSTKICYTGPRRKLDAPSEYEYVAELDRLLAISDIVVVLCPLNDSTLGLFNAEKFNLMKKSAVFVNVSRGPVVNQDDLVTALENNTIYAAALDVTTPEPLPVEHPLNKLSNCFILPHITCATVKTRNSMAEMSADSIIAQYKKESVPNVVQVGM